MQEFTEISDLIVEHNNQFIVAKKPSGMPCVPDQTGDKNLKNLLEAYSKHDLFIVNRIDRPVSGMCLFAKNANAAKNLSDQLVSKSLKKNYLAIVEGKVKEDQKTLTNYLIRGKGNKAIVVDKNHKEAKEAKLTFKVLERLDNYTIVYVEILTGRFHQIRCQLANLGHPIKGDVKYGARRKNKDRSIYLHAYELSFAHPVTKIFNSYKQVPNPSDSLWKLVTLS